MDENFSKGSLPGNRTRVLCKFFANGACLKGEHCEFPHDRKDPANNVCTFYQKGACAYGSRCRYDHVKVSRPQASTPSSSTNPQQNVFSQSSQHNDLLDDGSVAKSMSNNSAEVVMCSFAAVGNCPRGDNCPHIHGDLCQTCRKQYLHPFRPDEREEHVKSCEKKAKHLDALKRSEEIECSVCLERVLSKPTAAERKFGLLSECDHPFCISCIRNWRSSSPTSGTDVNSALRACPICRKLSYFVIPSVIWYSTKEEKQEIVDSYKARLRSIDCKHFDFGNGTCPFGTSCFYKHTVKRGSLLWNNSLGSNSGGIHRENANIEYSYDDTDDDFEGGSSGDDLADAIVAAEAMAFLQMHSGFQMEENPSEEGSDINEGSSDEEDTDDGSSDDGSSGEALAQAYLLHEMRTFLQMF